MPDQKLANPAYHIHAGDPQPVELPVNFSMLLEPCQRRQRPR
jgi:hypothetical protein